MKKIVCLVACLFVGSANAASIAVIDPSGNTLSNSISAANTLEPSSISNVSGSFINSQTAASLIASYDALVFSWYGSSYSSSFWSNTLVDFINLGGGVIFDGASGATSALNGSGINFFGTSTFSSGAEAVTDNFFTSLSSVHGVNHHLGGLSGNANWAEFLSDGTTTLGMYASFGLGKVIVTSTDFFFHGSDADDLEFLVDEIKFVTNPSSSVPEPSVFVLTGLGLVGIGFSRKAKARNS